MQLSSDSALQALGLNEAVRRDALALGRPELRLVRVVEPQRSQARVDDGEQLIDATLYSSYLAQLKSDGDALAVGDWAGLDTENRLRLHLPRRGLISRPSKEGGTQVVAAHIDLALLVMGLDSDWAPHRLQRYLMLVRRGGVSPVVVLSKRDQCDEAEQRQAEIQAMVGDEVPVHAINARSAEAVNELRRYAAPGRTLVLLGSSGVGKSTLTNALAGSDQLTQATRAYDGRGRHTTTARSMYRLPDGGCLIDTPGMRGLRLTGAETLTDAGFDDVAVLAQNCRFANCRHDQEPGCAVREAVGAVRLTHYHALLHELERTRSDTLTGQRPGDKHAGRGARGRSNRSR